MSSAAKAGITVIIFSVIFWVACNEAFRPIVIAIPNPGADPGRLSAALVLSNNNLPVPGGLGGLTTIDVSGDTAASVQYAGHNPVHVGIIPGGSRAYIVNKADDTVTMLVPGNVSVAPTTITLPVGAQPVFAHSTLADRMYVAESGPVPGRVAQISAAQNILTNEIVVGSNPVALAETPNGQKLYVVNQGDNTVTIIQTADGSVLNPALPVGTAPVWAVASTDGQFVFVANSGSNDVTVIGTTNDATPLETIALGASPSFLAYDPGLKRVYAANTASNTVSIMRADQPLPTLPSLLTPGPGIPVGPAPCNGSSPAQVAALPDGSRAYVANSATNNVCVISSLSNTITKSISVGTAPISVGASADGTRVYVANSGSHNISIIRTDQDTVVTALLAPKTDPNCQDPAPPAPPDRKSVG
jgi:YVTN family beta-propeller protein